MTTYFAFLRGINVGGKNKLPMKELLAICEDIGFRNVRTYIQSGNVIFESPLREEKLIKKFENALFDHYGKPIRVVIRALKEVERIAEKNPFPKANPAQVGVMLFASMVSKSFLSGVSTTTGEELKVSKREVYIHYPNGMGRSKLKLPKQAEEGTVRNLNTINKVLEIGTEK